MHISVVIPVYGCKPCLQELYERLVASLSAITAEFEIILVNDACPQNSWEVVRGIALHDKRVVGIDLSRNFGQIRAITAGLDHAKGDWVVVMDCDLQDKPEEIIRLYQTAQQGYDVVFSRRAVRKDTLIKRAFSKIFYAVYSYMTGGAMDGSVCNFSISRRFVVENYRRMREQNRAFILFIKWMGFKSTAIDIDHAERGSGKSSYNMARQLKLASEIITSQSNKPLVLSIKIGFTMALISFLYAMYLVIRYLATGASVSGWTSTIVSIYFVGGVLMANLGVLGLYIGYIFNQTKDRPLYIVRETIEDNTSQLGGSQH